MIREHTVSTLMTAANRGMHQVAEEASPEEVFSAYVQLARNAVLVALDTRVDMEPIREALMAILILAGTDKKAN